MEVFMDESNLMDHGKHAGYTIVMLQEVTESKPLLEGMSTQKAE
jgi:hypothetical protein